MRTNPGRRQSGINIVGWQDISMAPKDGTTVLVAWPTDHPSPGWEVHTAYCVIDDGIWWHESYHGERLDRIHPVMWHSLPPTE